mmetsp:Transcript_10526/g.31006  ORF Transcript_10526/g.31006 Transcript_10526/m.31006 type:complete len:104 (-) Transcript_10526:829-1140(-)
MGMAMLSFIIFNQAWAHFTSLMPQRLPLVTFEIHIFQFVLLEVVPYQVCQENWFVAIFSNETTSLHHGFSPSNPPFLLNEEISAPPVKKTNQLELSKNSFSVQ